MDNPAGLMKLITFFEILDTEGEDAAVRYAERVTGQQIDKSPRDARACLSLVGEDEVKE